MNAWFERNQSLKYRRLPSGAISIKKSQVAMATWSQGMLVPKGNHIIFFSYNRIKNLILIILDHFPFN
jgi:hypothetical protein